MIQHIAFSSEHKIAHVARLHQRNILTTRTLKFVHPRTLALVLGELARIKQVVDWRRHARVQGRRNRDTVVVGSVLALTMESERRHFIGSDVRPGNGNPMPFCLWA